MAEEDKKEETPNSEEVKKEEEEEQELSAEVEEDKIRKEVVENLELSEEDNAELIDKLVKEKVEDRKRFGKLVGQKRGWRERFQKTQKKPDQEGQPGEDQPPVEDKGKDKLEPITAEEFDKRLAERDFQRELKEIDCSDELRKEVESFAKLHNVSPKEAFQSNYIQFQKKQEDDKKAQEEAGAGGPRRTWPTEISKKKPEELSGEGEAPKSLMEDLDPVNNPKDREEYAKRLKEWQKDATSK